MTHRTYDQARRALEEEYGELLEAHEGGDGGDFSGYADDPVGFIREVLREEPWAGQVRIAEAVRDHREVSVRSCNAAGKGWILARLALWFAYARDGRVIITAPTEKQLTEQIFRRELWRAWQRNVDLPGHLFTDALRPSGEGEAAIVGKTATGVSSLTGFHGDEVLFIIDEAQDHERLDPHAWDAAYANATGEHDRKLAAGNPLDPAGRFYRTHQPSSEWHSIRIPASEIPNVREGRTVIPGLLTREAIDDMAAEYGEGSGFYTARVLAEFPEESEEGVFVREWLDAAADREVATGGKLVAALDPARFGPDASVLAIRRGNAVQEILAWEGRMDTMELAERAANALQERGFEPRKSATFRRHARMYPAHARPNVKPVGKIIVDEVGVGGGVKDRLEEDGWNVEGFNGGRRPQDPERYFNTRAEVYWTFRRLLERGEIALPQDERLFEELLALRWRPTGSGQIQLESKRDLKGRIGRSPDRSDAVSMAFSTEVGPKKKLNLSKLTWGGPSDVERGRAWNAYLMENHRRSL